MGIVMKNWQREYGLKKLKNKLKELNKDLDEVKLDLENLQPKFKDAKQDWENFQPQLKKAENNLNNLQSQLQNAEKDLADSQSELDDDEILDLKFMIKKLKKKEIRPAEEELTNLIKKEEVLRSNVDEIEKRINVLQEKKKELEEEINSTKENIEKIQQDDEYRKDRLFKKLYVEFDDDVLSSIFNFYNIKGSSDEDKLELLIERHSEEEIYAVISEHWCDNCFTYIPETSEYCPYCGSTNIIIKKKMID